MFCFHGIFSFLFIRQNVYCVLYDCNGHCLYHFVYLNRKIYENKSWFADQNNTQNKKENTMKFLDFYVKSYLENVSEKVSVKQKDEKPSIVSRTFFYF